MNLRVTTGGEAAAGETTHHLAPVT